MANNVVTVLECDHSLYWDSLHRAPDLGTSIWCQECKDMRRVKSLPGSWMAQCLNCKWHKRRMTLKGISGPVNKHVAERDHAVFLSQHGETEGYTVSNSAPSQLFGRVSATMPPNTLF